MSSSTKLTKKQKKGLAFRERKQGQGKKSQDDQYGHDFPVSEVTSVDEVQAPNVEIGTSVRKNKSSGTGKRDSEVKEQYRKQDGESNTGSKTLVEGSKKRKREVVEQPQDDADQTKPAPKRKRGTIKEVSGPLETVRKEQEMKIAKKGEGKQRFILFIGNLRYTTSLESIKEHFAACDPPPTIRLLTPKANPQKPSTALTRSKGCAFLEFSHRNALQQALKLHQTELNGRRINVELTAGGGGKGDTRLAKVRERNKGLDSQRKPKTVKSGDPVEQDRPQRFSTTSGREQERVVKRTWTVGDVEDTQTHRGGQRHVRGSKKVRAKSKAQGTGVNAIPVG